MTTISANLQAVRERIDAAAKKFGRNPGGISLLAVSKTWPATDVQLAANAGQHSFGENYVQEGVMKIEALRALGLEWHFIGPLQSNKTRQVAETFDWVHSLDRSKIAERLSEQRPAERLALQVCLQVNVSSEATKSGVPLEAIDDLAQRVAELPHLQLRGLMAIPAPTDNFEQQRSAFRKVREAFDRINSKGLALDTLSMGMSHDLEAAIAEGATMVRVGSAIFGERHKA